MLADDAARLTAARLTSLGVPVIAHPQQYGSGGIGDFAWHALNRPRGWVYIPPPRAAAPQGWMTAWTVAVEAAAATPAQALMLARAVQDALYHSSRRPTGFFLFGDLPLSTAGGHKHVLTFTAHLRHGD